MAYTVVLFDSFYYLAVFLGLLAWMVKDSEPGTNKYGNNPKGIHSKQELLTVLSVLTNQWAISFGSEYIFSPQNAVEAAKEIVDYENSMGIESSVRKLIENSLDELNYVSKF